MDYNGVTYAYIGDAVYEVFIREYLLSIGLTKVDHLHKKAIEYTSAVGQAKAYHEIKDLLTDQEQTIFKRGRNASTDRKAKNASLSEYRIATGFEALIGYLYLQKDTQRIQELLEIITK